MDEREKVLRSVEDEEIKLVKTDYYDVYYDFWNMTYKVKKVEYPFQVIFSVVENTINIRYPGETLEENPEYRYQASVIAHRLYYSIKEKSKYSLKIILDQYELKLINDKYIINDVEQFEERKKETYIKDHQETIDSIFKESLEKAKNSKSTSDDLFLIIKELDELPLCHYLIEKHYMHHVIDVNNEKVLRLAEKECDWDVFYEEFTFRMRELGYNLCYEVIDYGSWDRFDVEDDYFPDWYSYGDGFYEGDEGSYLKKKNRQKKRGAK